MPPPICTVASPRKNLRRFFVATLQPIVYFIVWIWIELLLFNKVFQFLHFQTKFMIFCITRWSIKIRFSARMYVWKIPALQPLLEYGYILKFKSRLNWNCGKIKNFPHIDEILIIAKIIKIMSGSIRGSTAIFATLSRIPVAIKHFPKEN